MIRLGMIRIMIRAILGVPIILRAFSTIADAWEKHRWYQESMNQKHQISSIWKHFSLHLCCSCSRNRRLKQSLQRQSQLDALVSRQASFFHVASRNWFAIGTMIEDNGGFCSRKAGASLQEVIISYPAWTSDIHHYWQPPLNNGINSQHKVISQWMMTDTSNPAPYSLTPLIEPRDWEK